MARFILRNSGGEESADLANEFSNVKVIDRSPGMMLIDADEDDARQLANRLPGWTLHPEVTYQIPDTRKRIVNKPD